MSRIKLIVLSMFAVLAVGAVASSSASAQCSDGGTKSVWCDKNNNEITNELVLGESGLSLLFGTVGTVELKLHCKDDKFHGFLLALGTGHGTITYLGCTVVAPTGCTVTEPIIANVLTSLSENVMPATGTFTGAGPGEEFAKVTIGTCASAKGSYTVNGLQLVTLPNSETSSVEHEIVAKKSGSHLSLGGNVASYSGTASIHLASSLPWLVMLGS